MLIEDLLGQSPSAPTAGVLKVLLKPLDWGVRIGVGKGPRRGRAGRMLSFVRVARGVGSNVLGILFAGVGVGSFDSDQVESVEFIAGMGVTGAMQLEAASSRVWVFDRSRSFTNAACPKSRLSSSGVRREMIAFHVSIAPGDDRGDESDDADGEYLNTTSVHR